MLSGFVSVCWAAPATEAEADTDMPVQRQIQLQGILGEKAVLFVDGERKMVSVGKPPFRGVRLLRVLPDAVEVNVDGQPRRLTLGGNLSVSGPIKVRESVTVTVPRDKSGMYSSIGSINGLTVKMLVDTGASTVAMNEGHARRLGVDYRVRGQPVYVGTASGVARAHQVNLKKVTLGGITLRNVPAVVIEGRFPVQVLLGMSFLGQLDVQHQGTLMRLKKTR